MSRRGDINKAIKKLQFYNEPFFGDMPLAKRLKRHPFLVLFVAVGRRALGFLIHRLKLFPHFFRAKTFFGETMLVGMPAGFVIWWYGFLEGWELPLATFIVNHVRPGDVFFDVGANDGYFTLLGASLVGGEGHVYSFEPSPSSYGRFRPEADKRKNITFEQKALFDKAGEVPFLDFGELERGGSSSVLADYILGARPELNKVGGRRISVPSVTLDEYAREKGIKPSFLQIDTEGSEYEILRGASRVLKECKPFVAVEVLGATERSGKYAEMAGFMRQFGYTPYDLTRQGEVRPVAGKPESGTVIFVPQGA